mmetsp:Transcript_10660/g.11507  ORF Transcript_10660/g.11507 Transcript_10660/m.11507 type:complete len:358 (-) Transcript_10660:328-1401(-)
MIAEFDPSIVVLSYGVAFIGVYISICACEQLRGIYLKYGNPKIEDIIAWLMLIGISIGGGAMWGVHFVGTMTIKDNNNNTVHYTYNVTITIISMIVGIITSSLGVYIASKDRLYAKSKVEILEIFVSTINLDEILSYNEFQILFLLATKELKYLVCGGLIAGAGGVGVLYINIAALEFPGYIEWNWWIVLLSVVLALSSGCSAFWIFFRLLSIYPDYESLRFATGFAGGFGVCVVHYVAVVAADFQIDSNRSTKISWNGGIMTDDDSFYLVLLAAMLLFWIIVMVVFADLRRKINLYRIHLQKLAPNEKLSDLLNTAESSLDPKEANTQSSHTNAGKRNLAKNAVAPLPFDDDEYPL